MNQAEISTLIANGVDRNTIAVAEATGHMMAALRRTRAKVMRAESDMSGLEWRELCRIMEAVNHEEAEREADKLRADRIRRENDAKPTHRYG